MKKNYGYEGRFDRIRLGRILSDVNSDGLVDVRWLDSEAGGRSEIAISYPCFNTVMIDGEKINPWGIELGFGKGVIGIFGFLTDGTAVILGTMLPRTTDKNTGFYKTEKIKSGEFRITSKGGAKIFLNELGDIELSLPASKQSIKIAKDTTITISDQNGNSIVLDGTNIIFGKGTDVGVLGNELKTLLSSVITAVLSHTHSIATVPPGVQVATPTTYPLIDTTSKILSKKIKVE